jgi:malonate decarboxylase beta subunit
MAVTDQDQEAPSYLIHRSFIEMRARERARAILDPGTFRELLGPFDRLKSPWLPRQGVVAQADDGVVVARGTLDGRRAATVMIESAFQGGSIGEVSGAKVAGTLELAYNSWENGRPTIVVLGLESGGVRLQEANLGLAAIAEIHAGIIALRAHVPVIGVISGTVGCFGGMSLAAALCTCLVVTREARLGMNGPEVIEQQAGLAELDAADRLLIWRLIGGEQRYSIGLADVLVEDDADAIAAAVRAASIHSPGKSPAPSTQVIRFLQRLKCINPAEPPDAATLRALWSRETEP